MSTHPTLEPPGTLSATSAKDVLLVQEDAGLRDSWGSALRRAGYEPHPLETIEDLFEALLEILHWRAIVVDMGFRGPEATSFLDRLRADRNVIPAVMTGWDRSLTEARAAKAYPGLTFLPAPLQPDDLVSAVGALPAPPGPRRPESGLFYVHKPEGMERGERERTSLLPEAVAARADAERKAAEEARAPRQNPQAARELERARAIQLRLLPGTIPQPDGFEIAAQYLPAELVGGDYYDVIPLPDGRIAMIVADVSGKGISAAMVMVMARTVLHSVAAVATDARQLVIESADRIAPDLPGGTFISLACGLLDPQTGAVSVVNAGHMPPLLWSDRDGSPFVSTLDVSGGAIGVLKGARFRQTLRDLNITLQPREQLVFFTDGVNEAMDRRDEEFGDQRLHRATKQNGGTTAEDMAQGIVNSVLYHRGRAPASDDITVMAVMRK